MSERPRNPIFARLFVSARCDEKVWPLTDAAYRLHWDAVMWSREQLSDGFIPAGMLAGVSPAKNPKRCVTELLEAGLWVVVEGGWQIHAWARYQETRAEVQAKSAKRTASGKAGAAARWRQGEIDA